MFGGRKSRRVNRKSKGKGKTGKKHGGKNTTRRNKRASRRQRGGTFAGLAGIAKTALVPFSLFAAQKMLQRRTSKKTNGKRSRR